jgi:REP-associated tyrosine transposase
MHKPRPARLRGHSYVGASRYHVRTSTFERHAAFAEPDTVATVKAQLLRESEQQYFAILAYCFMPDHVHVLLEALDERASLCALVRRWKQASGFWYAKRHGRTLWQSGYFDRVLRREETTQLIANYIVANPIKAGLATRVGEYPFAWIYDSVRTAQD